MPINANTQLNLVIGNPIKHSESPRLHKMVYDALGINAVMLAIENPHLPDLVKSIRTLSVKLTAVTLPFKTSILSFVDTQSDAVSALQAANTLIYDNGNIHAENTDVEGIRKALANTDLHKKNIVIIGAGGSARAVAYALTPYHPTLYWLNRTAENAHQLIGQWGGTIASSELMQDLPIDIIINTTPIGMNPNADQTPLPGYIFKPEQTVFDLIYTPRQTRLLKEADLAGATCISGIHMFVAQAIKQIELFSTKTMDTQALLELLS
ncbi:MAG: shikimate dehydrogenase [Gammaproteobacteria bacterium]